MKNNISPEYLSTLVPQPVETATRYNLRDTSNIRQPLTRTQIYYNSFIPSSTRLWNELPVETRATTTFTSFKYQTNKNVKKPPKYYTAGNRFAQIKHTRLRTYCSSLKHHLFSKNIIDDPYFLCGSDETTKHYLLECQHHTAARTEMINRISRFCTPNLNCILLGDTELNYNNNSDIKLALQKFIFDSKCYKSWGLSLSPFCLSPSLSAFLF